MFVCGVLILMTLEECLEKKLIKKDNNTFERINGSLKVSRHFLEREGSFNID